MMSQSSILLSYFVCILRHHSKNSNTSLQSSSVRAGGYMASGPKIMYFRDIYLLYGYGFFSTIPCLNLRAIFSSQSSGSAILLSECLSNFLCTIFLHPRQIGNLISQNVLKQQKHNFCVNTAERNPTK